jgi:hypothetical protein
MSPTIERKCTQILETVLNGNYFQQIQDELDCHDSIDPEEVHSEKQKLSRHLTETYKGGCEDNAEENRIARTLGAILEENRTYKCSLNVECPRDCFNLLRHTNDAIKTVAYISDAHNIALGTLKEYLRHKQEVLLRWLFRLSQKDLTEQAGISPLFPPLSVEEILQSTGHLERKFLHGREERRGELSKEKPQ